MLGIDLVKIERIDKVYDRFGTGFLKKLLTEPEIKNFKNTTSLAGIWAAKEAVSKALGSGIGAKLSFLDIEIRKEQNGRPFALLSKKSADFFGVTRVEVSISHDSEYAVAAAFVYPPPTN
mgnify:FL=1